MSNNRTKDIEKFAVVFKALSNPSRLRIFLRLLSCCGPAGACEAEESIQSCVGEITADLGIVPSTASHHLRELRNSGLIKMERQGRKIGCCVNPETLQQLKEILAANG